MICPAWNSLQWLQAGQLCPAHGPKVCTWTPVSYHLDAPGGCWRLHRLQLDTTQDQLERGSGNNPQMQMIAI